MPTGFNEYLGPALEHYRETWAELPESSGLEPGTQRETIERFFDFASSNELPFDRSCVPGHFTGSAMVIDGEWRVLLTLHRKLGKWLQLGGHADGDGRLDQVALREGLEESGLAKLEFFAYESVFAAAGEAFPLLFDLDIHWIPERSSQGKVESGHHHLDARYLLFAPAPRSLQISEESDDLRWFPLEEASRASEEPSMMRQFNKLKYLRSLI